MWRQLWWYWINPEHAAFSFTAETLIIYATNPAAVWCYSSLVKSNYSGLYAAGIAVKGIEQIVLQLQGAPSQINLVPLLMTYDTYLHYHSIIFKGDKNIVPTALRNNMLERIHIGHIGIECSEQGARDALFWPGMGKDIATTV